MKKQSFFFTLALILSIHLFASLAVGAPKGAKPELTQAVLNTMFFQAINVAILFSGLIWFVWPALRTFVKTRALAYEEASKKAQLELQRATAQMQELNQKIQTVEVTRNEVLVRAQSEAADLKKQILADAKERAERLKNEIQFQMEMETERAKNLLRSELLSAAVQKASGDLKSKLSKDDHSKLLAGFTASLKETRP